ncbi:MAG: ATP-binding cassette domain-containing protein [Peptoanaerobacter stomatis]|uniref:ATP-binding cassette domain-containing protein n=1 Tax=Peptoanaerobacter stomatis TaxID=796937 RepID=UPI003F9F3F00
MQDILLDVNIQKKLNFFDLDVSFSLSKGLLAIQGLSGSGKTTTLDCISGLKIPDKGYIKLNGRYLYSSEDKINLPIRKRKVGYVFQSYALFPNMTVKNNIFFGINKKDNIAKEYALNLANNLNIIHLLDRYPSDISGGEKQRVALARALAVKPEILLLDEPFSALDEDLKERLYEDFLSFKEKENIPMILITHNKYEAQKLADTIIHFESGNIVGAVA